MGNIAFVLFVNKADLVPDLTTGPAKLGKLEAFEPDRKVKANTDNHDQHEWPPEKAVQPNDNRDY